MYIETKKRSIAKTLSWRFWATMTTIALVFAFTGRFEMAATIGVFEVVLKMMLYFVHERAWGKVKVGIKSPRPAVVWFTGLSGSGKSTVAEALYKRLKARGWKVEHLDGDNVRDIFPKTGFTKDERNQHIKRIGYLASKLEQNGVIVLATFISPYKETREFARGLCDNFIEVHVSTPLEECEKRDVKGLYRKARAGEIKNFTGLDDPYEAPESPEIDVDTSKLSLDESCKKIIGYLKKDMK